MHYRLYNPDGRSIRRSFNDLEEVTAYINKQRGKIDEVVDNASEPGVDIYMEDGDVWFAEIKS